MNSYCLVVFTIASVAFAQRPAPSNINDVIDKQLAEHNKYLGLAHKENLTLPGGTSQGLKFSEGIQHFVNTMKRTGDGFAVRGETEGTVHYKYKIGYEKLAFSFEKVTLGNGKELQDIKIHVTGGNSVLFYFTVSKSGDSCKVTLDEYKFDSLEGLTVEGVTASPEETTVIKTALMEHINASLEAKKQGVEAHLQAVCSPPKDWPTPSH